MTQQADDEQVIDEVVDQHDAQTDDVTGETPAPSQDGDAPVDDDAEVVITLGDDSPPSEEDDAPQAAPAWVKELRKADREKAREIRELKAKLAETTAPKADATPASDPKPSMTDPEIDYDEDVYDAKLREWLKRQESIEARKREAVEQQQKQQAEWESKRSAYDSAKASLKVANFDDAEDTLKEAFSPTQQAVLLEAVEAADMQAKLVYALGNNPAELKRLSAISNPIKFAIAASQLESKLKVAPRKAPPAPEKVISGRTTAVGVQDTKLARLEAAAERTGDYSEVFAHKRELRRQQA